jgi:hypothetical protein
MRDPKEQIEFILKMLGIFYEMSDFGKRDEITGELEKVKASSNDPVSYFTGMLRDFEKEYESPNSPESLGHTVLLSVIYASLAHYAEATREDCELAEQWFHIGWAYHYLGYLRGTVPGYRMGRRAESSIRAKKGATARHKENKDMKKDAFDFLSKRMGEFKSMNAAADAVRGVVPVQFRTARDWVGEWNKNNKST